MERIARYKYSIAEIVDWFKRRDLIVNTGYQRCGGLWQLPRKAISSTPFLKTSHSQRSTFMSASAALAVRSAATYIRAAAPLNKAIARNRLTRIQDDFDSYTKVKSEFAKRIHSLNETMMARRLSPNDESRFIQRGREKVDEVLLRLDSKCQEVQNGIDAVCGAMNDTSGTDVVYVQVHGKKVSLFNTTEKSESEDS
jgi:hypothetical protein